MPLLAVPNVSEGRDTALIEHFVGAMTGRGARLLDGHSDAAHNRTVLTVTGSADALIDGMVGLADAARAIDLTKHEGVHPRLGTLDVCPFVPYQSALEEAVEAARTTGSRIGALGIPVFLYGEAASRRATRDLPDLRRGGLEPLIARVAGGFAVDEGPSEIDPRVGVVCVGARGPLIAFNVWLEASADAARTIAQEIRHPGLVRALAFEVGGDFQISMNLLEPDRLGIDAVFDTAHALAERHQAHIRATEIVGLVEDRFLPKPDAQAARLLLQPGRSVESALSD